MNPLFHLIAALSMTALASAAEPAIIADFETPDYAGWKTEGSAFGDRPAAGAFQGQMKVAGFLGTGLVNSFNGGDEATGKLISPPFRIERKHLTFLIGGGGWAGETCIDLRVDGQIVRTATGSNTEPGGSERLRPAAWDIAEFTGRMATIEIVDQRQGTWGHINIDQLAQTDDPPVIASPHLLSRTLPITAGFLQLPLTGREEVDRDELERFTIEMDGRVVRALYPDLATAERTAAFTYPYDLREFRGKTVTLRYRSSDAAILDRLVLSDDEPQTADNYAGPHRPQFHFSPRRGWMNDINGTFWHDGLYHLFYQFNPTNKNSGPGFDMHWGHSVSKDLVHWEEWPVALYPDAAGECYSGTAIVTPKGIPGLVSTPSPLLVFTASNPFSQHLATTADGGRTWQRFAGNPVVPKLGESDRDPKVIWHEASAHYIMVLYVGGPDTYRILRSKDLLKWEQTASLPYWFECPEFIPVKSAITGEELMLLYGCHRAPEGSGPPFRSDSCYQLGRFDGKTFLPVTEVRHAHLGPNYYGALTFVNDPKGRAVMMGWARGSRFPGEKFNQCSSVPLQLQVRAIAGKDSLCFEPVEEIQSLRGQPLLKLDGVPIDAADASLRALPPAAALDVVLRFRASTQGSATVTIRNIVFHYDATTATLTRNGEPTILHPEGSLGTRYLIDSGIVESFWNGGEAAYAISSLSTDGGPAFSIQGDAMIEELTVYPMKSIWKDRE